MKVFFSFCCRSRKSAKKKREYVVSVRRQSSGVINVIGRTKKEREEERGKKEKEKEKDVPPEIETKIDNTIFKMPSSIFGKEMGGTGSDLREGISEGAVVLYVRVGVRES